MSNPAYDTAEQALEDIQGILVKAEKASEATPVIELSSLAWNTLADIQERIDRLRNPA